MLNDIVEEHADEASFLWRMRQQALDDWSYDLGSLADIDRRIDAHLQGLLIAGDASAKVCVELFDDWNGGECFVAAFALLHNSDEQLLQKFIAEHSASAESAAGIVSALAWANWEQISAVLQRLMSSGQPPLEQLALQVATHHRADIGPFLERYLLSQDSGCRAAALEYAGTCGKVAVLPACKEALTSDDPELQQAAALACYLLGDNAGREFLQARAEALGEHALEAGVAAVSRMNPSLACSWVSSLIAAKDTTRLGLRLAGMCGYKAMAPELLQAMRDPSLARLAFVVFHHAYGVDYTAAELEAAPVSANEGEGAEDQTEEMELIDADEGLLWPDVHALTSWWLANQKRFADDKRLLLGAPVDDAQLLIQLKEARQPIRCAAAFEAAARVPNRPVFNVIAPASRQKAALGA